MNIISSVKYSLNYSLKKSDHTVIVPTNSSLYLDGVSLREKNLSSTDHIKYGANLYLQGQFSNFH